MHFVLIVHALWGEDFSDAFDVPIRIPDLTISYFSYHLFPQLFQNELVFVADVYREVYDLIDLKLDSL